MFNPRAGASITKASLLENSRRECVSLKHLDVKDFD